MDRLSLYLLCKEYASCSLVPMILQLQPATLWNPQLTAAHSVSGEWNRGPHLFMLLDKNKKLLQRLAAAPLAHQVLPSTLASSVSSQVQAKYSSKFSLVSLKAWGNKLSLCWLSLSAPPDPLSILYPSLCPDPWDAYLDGFINRSILLSFFWLASILGYIKMRWKERGKVKAWYLFSWLPASWIS